MTHTSKVEAMSDDKNDTWNDAEQAAPNDSVGYCQPPKHTRFKPGQSGNRRGRPRGAKSKKKIVEEALNEMHWVMENGVRRRRSTIDLILLSLRNRAIEGNMKAFKVMQHLSTKYAPRNSAEPRTLILLPDNGR